VDLVIEDPEAGAESMVRERRKHESSVHSRGVDSRALRKVYRRGYQSQDLEHEETEVDVSVETGLIGEDGVGRVGPAESQPKKANVKVTKDEAEAGQPLGDPEVVEVAGMTVARATTLPLYARLHVELADEDNPWL